eukprot:jgi/Hompol1/2553/HPOL_002952-RA
MTAATHAEVLAEAQTLVRKRDALESQLAEFDSLLKSHNIGMTEPLVDREGFPRADVDVYAIRNARASIIRLRNDHKALTGQIEIMLQRVHALAKAEGIAPQTGARASAAAPAAPFARVNAVAPDSPCWEAGLLRDDFIVRFGPVTAQTESPLKALAEFVQANENNQVELHVLRGIPQQPVTAMVTPHKWSGRGLLG